LANSFVDLYPQYDVKKQENSACVNPFVESCLKSLRNPKNLNNDLIGIQNGVDVFIRSLNNAEKKLSGNPLQMFFTGLMNIIPAARRLAPIEDNEKTNNTFKAVGLGLLAVINLKEDLRDLLSVFGKTKSEINKEYKAVFKFFAGTPVETFLKKSELGEYIYYDIDTTMGDTFIGEKIRNRLGISEKIEVFSKKIYYPLMKNPETINRIYVKTSGPFIGKVISLSLRRVTKLGLIFATILELPAIIKSVKDKKYKQLPKSALNIIAYSLCGAFFSALGALTIGTAGSVLGLGTGFYLGNQFIKSLNPKF